MQATIQVLSQNEKSGVGKQSGNPYKMTICQCVVHQDPIVVGELILPKDHPPITTPGYFTADFGIVVGQDKRIGGQLVKLTPISSDHKQAKGEAGKAGF